MNTKSLMVSPKITKTDKFIPADILAKFYDTIDNIRDLFYVMWHCETGVRISSVIWVWWITGVNQEIGVISAIPLEKMISSVIDISDIINGRFIGPAVFISTSTYCI
jgi:hypothetical protein